MPPVDRLIAPTASSEDVTLDRAVRAAKTADLFSADVPSVPVLPADMTILEVKYSGYLPDYLRRALLVCDCRREAVSKYCLSRQMLY